MRLLLLLSLSTIFTVNYSFTQYCMTGGPTATGDSNIQEVTITGENGTSITYIPGCPGIIGIDLYTSETLDLQPGNTYTLNAIFGTCGGNYNGLGEIWIDYNQNTIFEPSESIGTWQGTPIVAQNFNFTVPAGAVMGMTRMRVMHHEDYQSTLSLPLDPCASFTWGSVTDINVNMTTGVDCSGYIGDDVNDPRIVANLPYSENYSTTVCYSNQHPVYSSPDVYYKVTVDPANPYITASLCGSNFDTYMTAEEYNGTFIAGNDDAPGCSPQSEMTFDASGYTYVYIIVEGWGAESGDYTLNINAGNSSGLEENELSAFEVYPNPNQGEFKVTSDFVGTIEVYSSQGALIHKQKVEQTADVDLMNVPSGIYYVEFITDNSSSVQKLVIK